MRSEQFIFFIQANIVRFLVFITLLPLSAHSQNIKVDALTDTNSIRIGQQFHLFLEATHSGNQNVLFPQLPDTFSMMEVVQRSDIDTVSSSLDSITRRQTYKITSFDSGYHVIQPFNFILKSGVDQIADTFSTRPILVTVTGVAVDTSRAIKDLKGQITVPYNWRDFLPWFLGVVLLILLIYLIKKYIKKRKSHTIIEKPLPTRPAHEIAMEALTELEAKKLWQNGNHKAYHSSISDIIRNFIEQRWHIHAMEMTTDEILKVQLIAGLDKKPFEELKYLLELADQVKFAKMVPVVFDNEQSIRNAYEFVESCKQNEKEKEAAS